MATVNALLAAIQDRVAEHNAQQAAASEASMYGWHRVSRNAARILVMLDPPPDVMAVLRTALKTIERRDAPVNSAMTAIGYTLGVLADTVNSNPDIVKIAGLADRGQLRSSVLSALHQVAMMTLTGTDAVTNNPGREVISDLGNVTQAFTFVPWRLLDGPLGRLRVGPTKGTLEDAVDRWAASAIDVLESQTRITSYAFQRTAATIARICRAAALAELLTGPGRTDGAAQMALSAAFHAWQAAADWPPEFRLGGRTTELRQRSRELDEALDARLLLPAGSPNDGVRAALLQAERVAACHVSALTKVVNTRSLWISVQALGPTYLARHPGTSRVDWVPDPGTAHGATLVRAVERANSALREAVDHVDRLQTAVREMGTAHISRRWEAVTAADRAPRRGSTPRLARSRTIGR